MYCKALKVTFKKSSQFCDVETRKKGATETKCVEYATGEGTIGNKVIKLNWKKWSKINSVQQGIHS